tara:strand:+ start:268 stop:627 length:360 start_codon:yes stop_codon:yes gene_type:complete
MGRYYHGDIEGKFMFAVQPSDAGERFGASECQNYIEYFVDKEDSYETLTSELKKIEESGALERVDKMLKENENMFNDLTMKKSKVSAHDMREFADYEMGKQMKDYFDSGEDYLSFSAEM